MGGLDRHVSDVLEEARKIWEDLKHQLLLRGTPGSPYSQNPTTPLDVCHLNQNAPLSRRKMFSPQIS